MEAGPLAAAAERLGYASVWTNDTPGADGLAAAAAMAQAASTVRVGVGAVPIDRRPVPEIARTVTALGLPLDRFVLVVGAGRSADPVAAVRAAVAPLRDALGPRLRVGVAAMGPRMCRLAGEVADLVLLNWMTPERCGWARERVAEGATRREPARPVEVAAYVRAAAGPGARRQIGEEAAGYARMRHYARHFSSMGADPASVGVALGERGAGLAPYEEVLDEAVVRALGDVLEVARIAAP